MLPGVLRRVPKNLLVLGVVSRMRHPYSDDATRMMMAFDCQVAELDAAVAEAVELEAGVAGHEPQDKVRVLQLVTGSASAAKTVD
jgi:hypothetical protein